PGWAREIPPGADGARGSDPEICAGRAGFAHAPGSACRSRDGGARYRRRGRRLTGRHASAPADHGGGHMRKGFLGSLAVLAAGAGLTFGQSFTPPGPGGPPPGPLPGTLPPPGMTTGNPPPGVAPYAYSGPSGANAGYEYASPDGHPLIMPPGLEG